MVGFLRIEYDELLEDPQPFGIYRHRTGTVSLYNHVFNKKKYDDIFSQDGHVLTYVKAINKRTGKPHYSNRDVEDAIKKNMVFPVYRLISGPGSESYFCGLYEYRTSTDDAWIFERAQEPTKFVFYHQLSLLDKHE